MNKTDYFSRKTIRFLLLNVIKNEKNMRLIHLHVRKHKNRTRITDFNYDRKRLIFPPKTIDSNRANFNAFHFRFKILHLVRKYALSDKI